MTDQLIEHIAGTIAVAELVRTHRTWGDLIEPQKDEYRRVARAVLAVFEKAHTPTDDERAEQVEAIVSRHLSRLAKQGPRWAEDDTAIGGQAANIARQLAEAGLLRRSEVPEPSAEAVIDEETDAIWQAIADALGGFGQVLNSHDETAEWVQRYLFRRTPEPQGEPSDAQVDRLIEAGMVALIHDSEVPTGMRPHILGGEVLVIRERTDAEPIVRAVIHAVSPALRAAGVQGDAKLSGNSAGGVR